MLTPEQQQIVEQAKQAIHNALSVLDTVHHYGWIPDGGVGWPPPPPNQIAIDCKNALTALEKL